MIRFPCSACQQVLQAAEEVAGRTTSCPRCGQRLLIPAAVADTSTAIRSQTDTCPTSTLLPPKLTPSLYEDTELAQGSELKRTDYRSPLPKLILLAGCFGVFVCMTFVGAAIVTWWFLNKSDRFTVRDNRTKQFQNRPPALPGHPAQPESKASDGRRHVDVSGKFPFVPPEGWMVRDFPGLKYPIVAGPAKNGFAPNINIVDEPFPGTLDVYVESSLATAARLLEDYRLVKRENFQSTGGLPGVRVVAENKQFGRHLRQTFYFFVQGDSKFVITCTAMAEDGEQWDTVFEASAKTFRPQGE